MNGIEASASEPSERYRKVRTQSKRVVWEDLYLKRVPSGGTEGSVLGLVSDAEGSASVSREVGCSRNDIKMHQRVTLAFPMPPSNNTEQDRSRSAHTSSEPHQYCHHPFQMPPNLFLYVGQLLS